MFRRRKKHVSASMVHRIILGCAGAAIVVGAVFVALRLPDAFMRHQLDSRRTMDAKSVEQAIEAYLLERVQATSPSPSSVTP